MTDFPKKLYTEITDPRNRVDANKSAPLLSLCIIARDNDRTIRQALASAQPWVDEIIVVDTGSVDSTPQIAKEFGARIEYFPWCDDFAAARNQSLNHATGQWLFWMDTDDTLPPESGKQLRDALQQGFPDDVLGLIMQVHCPSNIAFGDHIENAIYPPTPSTINCSSSKARELPRSAAHEPESASGEDLTVVDHVKVLRNRPDLRFEGRIHEQILPPIRRAGGSVVWINSYVVHSGSDQSAEGRRRKLDRDLRLLRLDVQERPDHPFVLFNLGMTLLHRGEYSEARTHLEDCIKRGTTDESHLRKAYALLIETLERLHQHQYALQRCWEGLGRFPNDIELPFKLGQLLIQSQSWAEAVKAFQRVLNTDGTRYFSSIDPGIRSYKTLANLALCHEKLNQHFEALGAWRACLNDAPGMIDAWEGILRVCREINQVEPLDRFASELAGRPESYGFSLVCRALTLGTQDQDDDAIDCFEQALEATKQHLFVLNEYARYHNERHRWDLSVPILCRLRDLDPSNPSPHFNLGMSLRHLGRYEEASASLQVALRLRPGHRRTHALLRECNQPATLIQSETAGTLDTQTDSAEAGNPILSTMTLNNFSQFNENAKSEGNKFLVEPLLSICVSLKNRSRIEHNGNKLKLFYQCVRSISEASKEVGPVELVVSDFQSTDWPLEQWIDEAAAGLSGKVIRVGGAFSRGGGLNLAAAHAESDRLLLLDADMLVTREMLVRGLEILEKGHAFFPIFGELSPDGKLVGLQPASFGNAFVLRSIFDAVGGVPEFKSWGGEDDIFHESVSQHVEVVREPACGFHHQWHPESSRHENYGNPIRSDYYRYFQQLNKASANGE